MKFAPLFGLSIRHSYYADGRCPDFTLEPAGETWRLLKNYRCILRTRTDGLTVTAELGSEGNTMIAMGAGVRLTFDMRMANPDASLFTDFSAVAKQPAPLYAGGAPGVPAGSLPLSSRAAPLSKGVFAAVEILVSAVTPGTAPAQFYIDFQAKQARWQYYCITDLNLTGKNLGIVDTAAPGKVLTFSVANRTDLVLNPDPSDALAGQLAERFPNFARLRYVSDDLITCQEVPRKLTMQMDGQNFPDLLPQPPLKNCTKWPPAAQGVAPQQDALFQVVQYLSYSFSKNGA